MSKTPIQCKSCGGANLTRVRPTGFVAFSKDYKCNQCEFQFPFPVPIWGAFLFMIIGFTLSCLGALWVYSNLRSANPLAIGIGGGILVMGVSSIWKGISSLGSKA